MATQRITAAADLVEFCIKKIVKETKEPPAADVLEISIHEMITNDPGKILAEYVKTRAPEAGRDIIISKKPALEQHFLPWLTGKPVPVSTERAHHQSPPVSATASLSPRPNVPSRAPSPPQTGLARPPLPPARTIPPASQGGLTARPTVPSTVRPAVPPSVPAAVAQSRMSEKPAAAAASRDILSQYRRSRGAAVRMCANAFEFEPEVIKALTLQDLYVIADEESLLVYPIKNQKLGAIRLTAEQARVFSNYLSVRKALENAVSMSRTDRKAPLFLGLTASESGYTANELPIHEIIGMIG